MSGMRPDLSEARRLLGAGMKLVRMIDYTKQPAGEEWNLHPITNIDPNATGYGLILAPNKLCSIDPDNVALARIGMRAIGFDLDELMEAGTRTRSTRAGSGGRSTFASEGDLCWLAFRSKSAGTVIEFRAESPNLQDTIPGIVYRDKAGNLCRQEYANCKRLDDAPPLPDTFFEWWARCSRDIEFLRAQETTFFAAIGGAHHPSISTGKGASLAYPAQGYRTAYNRAHKVEELLERHAYTFDRRTQRWAPPTATGAPGVRPIPGKDDLWRSDHASDPLMGTFDAWTAYVVLDHAGDVEAARRACEASGLVGSDTPPEDDRFPPIDQITDVDAVEQRDDDGAPATTSEGIPLHWISDLKLQRAGNYIIKGVLGSGALSVVYGDSNTGKTFFALDLACHVAQGIPWRGRRTRPGLVVYVAGEGFRSVEQRAIAYRDHKLQGRDIPLAIYPDAVNLLEQGADTVHLIRLIREAEASRQLPLALLIVDTLARAMPGGDESSGEDMGAVVRHADLIRGQTGAHLMFIHHCGKDAARGARGHSSLRAACDTEIEVSGTEGTRTAKVTKQRDHASGDAFGFDLEAVVLGEDEDGDEIRTCVVRDADAPLARRHEPSGRNQQLMLGAVRQYVAEHGDLIATPTWHDLCRAQGMAKSRWAETREALVKAGWLIESVGGLRYVP